MNADRLKDKVEEILKDISGAVGVINKSLDEQSIRLVFIEELSRFMMYLSAADGGISDEEAILISKISGKVNTPEALSQYILNNHIYSKAFETVPPNVLKIAVDADNRLGRRNDFSGDFIYLYETVGEAIVYSSGLEDMQKRNDFNTYINMMKKYRSDNLKTNSSSSVPAPQPVRQSQPVRAPQPVPMSSGTGVVSNSYPPSYCPMCSARSEWVPISSGNTGFSVGKAAAGAVLIGPLGLVAGALGKKTVVYGCRKCGFQQAYKK